MKIQTILFSGLTLYSCGETKVVQAQSQVDKRPNMIFIYADDWGWGDLSAHGSTWLQTPNIDRLISEGADFYNFNVLNPVSSPSRCGLLTGVYPARFCIHQHFASHQMNQDRGMPDWLDVDVPTLPRQLQKVGYKTAHYGKWHLAGLDSYNQCPHPLEYGYDDYAGWNGPKPSAGHMSVFEMAVDFVKKANDDGNPAFVNLWLKQTHTPHNPTQEAVAKYAHLDAQKQIYAAVVDDGDRGVGLIMDKLKELNLEENTIIFFSSDNGPEETGNENMKEMNGGKGTYYSVGETGGYKGKKRSLYEGGTHTPFIVRWPGIVKPGYIDKQSLITAVDILPTICEIAGADIPDNLDGESRLDVIKGQPSEHKKPVFWEWKGTMAGMNWPRWAVRDKQWKLLIGNNNKVELYDMYQDPMEINNVASEYPEIVKSLSAEVEKWKSTLPKSPNPNCMNK